MIWTAKNFTFVFPRPAILVGIVNVTPDSFSDGGSYFEKNDAVRHAITLVREGAEVIDIGGESTGAQRPPLSEAEEIDRVVPVIESLSRDVGVPISIDTVKVGVARAAIEAGASIVNDVGSAEAFEELAKFVADNHLGYVAMHMRGLRRGIIYGDAPTEPRAEVNDFFSSRLRTLRAAGVHDEQVVLDPGLGFGRTDKENLQILVDLRGFCQWKRPLFVALSRKRFIGQLVQEPNARERLYASIAAACWAVECGANLLRVHDVEETKQAVRMTEALVEMKLNTGES